MTRLENLYEITQRLCGMIEPLGESSVDEVRLYNLKDTIELTEKLINDIILVARHKDSIEHSMSKAGNLANEFITLLKNKLS